MRSWFTNDFWRKIFHRLLNPFLGILKYFLRLSFFTWGISFIFHGWKESILLDFKVYSKTIMRFSYRNKISKKYMKSLSPECRNNSFSESLSGVFMNWLSGYIVSHWMYVSIFGIFFPKKKWKMCRWSLSHITSFQKIRFEPSLGTVDGWKNPRNGGLRYWCKTSLQIS